MTIDRIIEDLEALEDAVGIEDPEVLYDMIEAIITNVEVIEELWSPKRIP